MMLPVAVIKEIESTYGEGRYNRAFIHDVKVVAVRPGYGRRGNESDSDLVVWVRYIEDLPVEEREITHREYQRFLAGDLWPDLATKREPTQFKAIYGIVDGRPRLWAD
jgi:hypothetical protein